MKHEAFVNGKLFFKCELFTKSTEPLSVCFQVKEQHDKITGNTWKNEVWCLKNGYIRSVGRVGLYNDEMNIRGEYTSDDTLICEKMFVSTTERDIYLDWADKLLAEFCECIVSEYEEKEPETIKEITAINQTLIEKIQKLEKENKSLREVIEFSKDQLKGNDDMIIELRDSNAVLGNKLKNEYQKVRDMRKEMVELTVKYK